MHQAEETAGAVKLDVGVMELRQVGKLDGGCRPVPGVHPHQIGGAGDQPLGAQVDIVRDDLGRQHGDVECATARVSR